MSDQIPWLQYIIQNSHVPQRVLLSFFGFLAIVNAYSMRLCLDVAIVQMIQQKRNSTPIAVPPTPKNFTYPRLMRLNITQFLLPRNSNFSIQTPTTLADHVETYDWSDQLQIFILASFYVGYVLGQVPSGQLAEKYGGKWVLSMSILLTAVCTLLTPVTIKVGGPIALIMLRLLMGLSESPTYPAVSTLLAQWVPACERGKLGVLVLSGAQVGVFVANFMSSLLLQQLEWSWIFYYFGCCSLLWFILFTLICYSDPESHPYISAQEKNYLRHEIKSVTPKSELAPTPWKSIITSVPMWALVWGTVQYDWSQFAEVSEVPKHMKDVNKLPLEENIVASFNATLPYIIKWLVSLLSGFLSDALVTNNIASTSCVRRIMTSIAAFGPRLVTSFVTCIPCERSGFLPIFRCAMGVMGTYYAGMKLSPLDMSPNYAGTLMGIANGMGSMTALIAPYWESFITSQHPNIKEFRGLLWILCTALSSSEVQPFNDPIPVNTLPSTSDADKNK